MAQEFDLEGLSSFALLQQYAAIMRELRRRNVVRSANNPVADLAELLSCRAFDLTLATKSTHGFDGTARDGARYQIKGRRRTPENQSTQLSAIRNLNAKGFEYLIGILFDETFNVELALRLDYDSVRRYAIYRSHVNGHILLLGGPLLVDPQVEDVTSRIQSIQI